MLAYNITFKETIRLGGRELVMKSRILKKFSVYDLLIIAMMSALGIAVKPVVVPLAHIITGPLYVPGGVVAGGFYMLWLVLGYGLVNKVGTATLIGLVQALLIMAVGFFGNQGAVSLITYVVPGLGVDVLYTLLRGGPKTPWNAFLGGVVANVSGTYLVSAILFSLPIVPLLLSLCAASLSGGLGGLIAYRLVLELDKLDILRMAKS